MMFNKVEVCYYLKKDVLELSRIDSKTIVDAFLLHPTLQFQSHVIDGLYSRSQERELVNR